MGMEFALDALGLGPRGGNLQNPDTKPDWRRASLTADRDPATGLPQLHKFNDTSTIGHKNEPPWARMAAYMLLAGRTNSEIGAAANVDPSTVSHLRAQRWFQDLLAVLANEAGQDIMGLLASEAAASVSEKLVTLRDSAESERVQMAAAQTLLEHAHGKAVQKNISIVAHSNLSPDAEFEELQKELTVLRQRNP